MIIGTAQAAQGTGPTIPETVPPECHDSYDLGYEDGYNAAIPMQDTPTAQYGAREIGIGAGSGISVGIILLLVLGTWDSRRRNRQGTRP